MIGSATIGVAGCSAAATTAAGSTRTGSTAPVLGGSTRLGSRTGARDSTSVDHSAGGLSGARGGAAGARLGPSFRGLGGGCGSRGRAVGLGLDDRLAQPLDEIEIYDRRAVYLQMAERETIDLEDAELLDPAQEHVGRLLHDEENARRPGGSLRHRIEAPERVGVLETPGVRVHGPEEKPVVGAEAERDQHQGARPSETDEVDRGLAKDQARVDDHQARLDTICIFDDEPLQVADVLDFELPERGSHHSLPWPFSSVARTEK